MEKRDMCIFISNIGKCAGCDSAKNVELQWCEHCETWYCAYCIESHLGKGD